jgi:hypothetical protein
MEAAFFLGRANSTNMESLSKKVAINLAAVKSRKVKLK